MVFEGRSAAKPLRLAREPGGYFSGLASQVKAGDLYRFRLDGSDEILPDPASRFQPDGPHGLSQVIDPSGFDWTDAAHPTEIAFHDRGPVDATHFTMGGSWSVYWYNGVIVSSEIARGLDIFELTPSEFLSHNEIDAAKSVKLEYLNTQGQPKYVWPATTSLAKAYLDQL